MSMSKSALILESGVFTVAFFSVNFLSSIANFPETSRTSMPLFSLNEALFKLADNLGSL